MAVDIESDELIFFPLLYWPVTAEQAAALAAGGRARQPLSRHRRHDPVRHPRRGRADARTVRQRAQRRRPQLRRLVAGIKIPPLVPVPPDHVLTKSFYLMHEFPGRWNGGQLWIEPVEDRVNDGVASVIVGGNDWAGAWAVDDQGRPAYRRGAGRRAAARDGVCASASISSCTC